jgi:hypothetical protein
MSKPEEIETEAERQCTHELKTYLHRWEEESDLEQDEILTCLNRALDEYYGEDVVEFECDFNLDEDGEEEGTD